MKTKATFDTSTFAMGAPADQDAVLYARHIPSNLSFSLFISEGSTTQELLSGDWEFRMMAWDTSVSPGPFTGTTRCKLLPKVTLSGTEAQVNFSINSTECGGAFFSHPDYVNAGQFQPVKFRGCMNLTTVTGAGSSCTPTFQSVRVSLLTKLFGSESAPNSEPLTSDCYPTGTTTPLLLPVKALANYPIKVRAYSDSSCATIAKEFTFKKGLNGLFGDALVFDGTSPNHTTVFLSSETPEIIAKNTTQLVYGSPILAGNSLTRTVTLQQPNHYSGTLATGCSLSPTSIEISAPSCTCSGGICSATVTATAGGSDLNYVDASYTLTDGTNTSNAAFIRFCFGGACPSI